MKTRIPFVSLASLALVASASADIFVLKDGTRLEGKILSETADTYHLEVQVTKSIRDEKKVAKSDVEKIEAEQLDLKAFEKIKTVVPTPDLLPNEEYDKRILTVATFLKDFPKSPLAKEANEILSTLKSEGSVVIGGGMKLGGKMITAAEYKADAYDLDARILELRIREAVAAGNYVGALRGLERMEQEYTSTKSRKALLPLRLQVLKTYGAQIDEQLADLERGEAERTANLARMSQEDRNRAQRGLAEDLEEAEARYQAEKSAEQRWITTSPVHKGTLIYAKDTVSQALSDEPLELTTDGGKIYRDSLKKIQENSDEDKIRDAMMHATDITMPKKYMDNLEAAAKAKGVTF